MVKEFHTTFGMTVNGPVTYDEIAFRMRLMAEEFREVSEAAENLAVAADAIKVWDDDEHITSQFIEYMQALAKELVDLQYVAEGTGVSLGFNMDAGRALVHEANMSKLGADGKPVLREDGKIMKSNMYKQADMFSVLPRAS